MLCSSLFYPSSLSAYCNKKLLLVDNKPELLKKITTAFNIKEEIAAAKVEKPDLAILDVMLPNGDGAFLFIFSSSCAHALCPAEDLHTRTQSRQDGPNPPPGSAAAKFPYKT